MALTAGTRLGPYEVQDAIGAGGMGEVYRARDTRLDRSVAIKILPEHLSNPKLKQRFEREAKAISGLSHANICALYDVGSENGVDFLVMEYLEGETLAERLAKGQISLEDILRFGSQIAEALDHAHRNGVVHRDLKPGNIMLTREGVKLLDFGLAKTGTDEQSDVSGSLPGFTSLPTQEKDATPLTQEGSILGTFQYMSPEQLEGKEADSRSDIFAMGAVLYEMATGQKAFKGDSQASLIAAIMSSQPRPVSDLAPMSPPALDHLVKACLTKDPEERIQTAHDVKLQLGWIAEGSQLGTPAPVKARRKTRSRVGWVAAGFFVLVSAALGKTLLDQQPTPREVQRVSILPPEGTTLAMEPPETMISPDGTMAVFVCVDSLGMRRLWLRHFDTLESEPLPGTELPLAPFWSPDSRYVGFFSEPHLKKINIVDGSVQIICRATSGRGGAWNTDGTILFSPASSSPLYKVQATGGEPFQVTELDSAAGETAQRFPCFLPDGRTFIYVSVPGEGVWQTKIASLDDPTPRILLRANSGTVYADPGYLIYLREGTLYAQAFDTEKLELTGEPVALPDRPGGYRNYNGSTELSASARGHLFYPQNEFKNTKGVWFDRKGTRLESIPLQPDNYENPKLSRDGRYLAVSRGSIWGREIWTLDLARGITTRVTFERRENWHPIWSQDGSEILFASTDDNKNQNLYKKNSTGSGAVTRLTSLTGPFTHPTDWSLDGEHVVFRMLQKETGNDLYILHMSTGDVEPYLVTRFNEQSGVVSPNGEWVAYRSDESGIYELYVQSFPEPGTKVRVSVDGVSGTMGTVSSLPMWTRDGRELIYIAGDRRTLKSAPIEYEPEFRVGPPRALFRVPMNNSGITTLDGQKFLILVQGEGEITPNLTLVSNWTEELRNR